MANHGVLAVGYGNDKTTGLRYVLIKNSWNTTWGDQGYFKLKFDETFICGFDAHESYNPILD